MGMSIEVCPLVYSSSTATGQTWSKGALTYWLEYTSVQSPTLGSRPYKRTSMLHAPPIPPSQFPSSIHAALTHTTGCNYAARARACSVAIIVSHRQ
jgi:hypothetical protein